MIISAALLALSFASAASATNATENCGRVPLYEKVFHRSINTSLIKADDGDFRILHGLDAVAGEWPWIVKIRECEGDNCGACTGTLLNSRWIISAGHCGYNRSSIDKYVGTVGLYDLLTPDKSAKDVRFDKVVVHPEYRELTNDIALFRLREPLELGELVQPACLVGPTRNVVALTSNMSCVSVGYGLIENMADALKLQKLEVRARKPADCNSDTLNNIQLRVNTVCIGPTDGKIGGSCQGDSGGPNLCYERATNRWFIFGTVSYGPANCDRDSDDDKWLTVSVDLSNYRSWILSVISEPAKVSAG